LSPSSCFALAISLPTCKFRPFWELLNFAQPCRPQNSASYDDDAVDGAEKPLETDTDSLFRLQMATWKPATQRTSDPLPRQTDPTDTEFVNDSVGVSGPVCSRSANKASVTAKTNQMSANRRDNSAYQSSLSCNKSSSAKMGRIASVKRVSNISKRKNDDDENVVDGHQRQDRCSLSDASLVSSVDVCTQSANAALQHPRHSSVELKRKLSTGKWVWIHYYNMLMYLPHTSKN